MFDHDNENDRVYIYTRNISKIEMISSIDIGNRYVSIYIFIRLTLWRNITYRFICRQNPARTE